MHQRLHTSIFLLHAIWLGTLIIGLMIGTYFLSKKSWSLVEKELMAFQVVPLLRIQNYTVPCILPRVVFAASKLFFCASITLCQDICHCWPLYFLSLPVSRSSIIQTKPRWVEGYLQWIRLNYFETFLDHFGKWGWEKLSTWLDKSVELGLVLIYLCCKPMHDFSGIQFIEGFSYKIILHCNLYDIVQIG